MKETPMQPTLTRRHWLALLATAAAAAVPAAGSAATPAVALPEGPLTIVVPFSAGGQFDGVARIVAKELGAVLGRTVVVENIGGAGGNIAAAKVARARPDGRTLLMYGGNYAVARELYRKLDYDPVADFAPVSRMSLAPHVLMASPALGVKDFEALRRRAAAGTPLSYGSPGIGTSMHLTFELVKAHYDLAAQHIPYKGGANVLNDLIGGQIELGIIAVGPALEFIRNGKVVALGVTSAKRSPALPEVPAFAEMGMPTLDAGSWSGLAVPRTTPEAVVAMLNAALASALAAPELRRLFDEQAFLATPGSPAEMRAYTEQDARRYAPVISKLALQAQ